MAHTEAKLDQNKTEPSGPGYLPAFLSAFKIAIFPQNILLDDSYTNPIQSYT